MKPKVRHIGQNPKAGYKRPSEDPKEEIKNPREGREERK